MKRVVLGICVAGMVIGLGACKKKQIKNINGNLTEGTWKVSDYSDNGQNETSDYNSAVFKFNDDGTVVVSGSHSLSGTWKVRKENSGDDHLFDDKHLELVLSFPVPFDELSDDWEIESQSDSKIDLKDDSDDDNEDRLTFVKI